VGSENQSCHSCEKGIQADDLVQGRAAFHDQKHWCPACLDGLLNRVSPEERRQILLSIRRSVKASEHGDLKVVPRGGGIPPAIRINQPKPPTVRVESAVDSMNQIQPRPRARRRFAGLIAVAAVVAVVGAGLALAVIRQGPSARTPASRPAEPAEAMSEKPAEPDPVRSPRAASDKDAALARFEAARLYALAHPEDLDRIVRMYRDAAEAAGGTALGVEIEREAAILRERLSHRIREEMDRFHSVADPLLEERRYTICRRLCEGARGLFVQTEWTDFVDRFVEEVESRAGREFEALELEARALARAGRTSEAVALLRRAAGFGLAGLQERAKRLEEELTSPAAAAAPAPAPAPAPAQADKPPATAQKPEPPKRTPAPPPPTPEPEPSKPAGRDPEQQRRLLDQAWTYAVKIARGREYDRAVQSIEFAGRSIDDEELAAEANRDAEMLRIAGTVLKGAAEELMKLKKDSQLTLRYLDDDDKARTARGRVVSTTADGVSLSSGDEIQLVPFTRLVSTEIIDYFSKRPGSGAQDARAVGLFSLFDGDLRRAKKELGPELAGLPEKYRSLGRDDGGQGSDPTAGDKSKSKDEIARELFDQAEKDFAGSRLKQALAGYQELRRRHRSSEVWRENRKSIEERLKTGLEIVALPGSFKASTYWTRQTFAGAPLPDAYVFPYTFAGATSRMYYLDIEFFAQDEAVYRIWVLVGGDGKENTAFQVQYTGAAAKDGKPAHLGQPSFVDVPPLPALASTTTKGSTTTWGWTSVAMHKFKEAGTQQFRIYASQRGMAIAAVVISAEKYRSTPPNPKDLGQ
jgi:hypothetical protein